MDIHALYIPVSSKTPAIKRQPPTAFKTASKCNFPHYRSPFDQCEKNAYFLHVYRGPVCMVWVQILQIMLEFRKGAELGPMLLLTHD